MSNVQTPELSRFVFGSAIPILRVHDLFASIGYYVDVLGFKLNWQAGGFASVSHDRCNIFLSEGDQGHPGAWVWIGVPNVQALFEHYDEVGANIRHPPANYPWGLEMQVEDLDGNVLRLGSDSKKDQPFGEWLDMHGHRWRMSEAGRWVRVDCG